MGVGMGVGADADTGADADAGTDADTGADTGADTDADTGAGADTGTGAPAASLEKASAISCADWNLSSGSRSRARSKKPSSAPGRSGLTSEIRGMGSMPIARMRSPIDSPMNGAFPVMHRNKST